jgi:hypothetical protein
MAVACRRCSDLESAGPAEVLAVVIPADASTIEEEQ